MALIKQIKHNRKVAVNIQVSKDLADEFSARVDYYNKHHSANAALDFDPLVKKIIVELKKINNSSQSSND